MKATLRVLAIGFSWMLIWGIVTFGVVGLTTDQRMRSAVSGVVGITLLASTLGLLVGVVYRVIIEIFAAKEDQLRRLRADIILGTIVCLLLLLALALTSYVKKRIDFRPELQKSALAIQAPITTIDSQP